MCELKCMFKPFGASKYFFCFSNRKWGLCVTSFFYDIIFFVGIIMSIVEINKYISDRQNYNEFLKRVFPVGLSDVKYF